MKQALSIAIGLLLAATNVFAQQIYFTGIQENEVWVANRDGSGTPALLYDNAGEATAIIAVLGDWNRLVWGGGNQKTLWTAAADGSGAPEMLWFNLDVGFEHLGVTLDPTTATLYWTTHDYPENIRFGNLDGTGSYGTIFSGIPNRKASGITLDAASQTLFWTSTRDDQIGTGPADGSAGPWLLYRQIDGVSGPRQIAYHPDGLLFWTEHDQGAAGSGRIVSAPADGSGPLTVLYTVPAPYLPWGIDIDGDTLIWTEFDPDPSTAAWDDRIMTGSIDGGLGPTVLFAGDFGQIRGIAAGHNIYVPDVGPPEQPIPVLGRWGIALLVTLVAAGALAVLRRSR